MELIITEKPSSAKKIADAIADTKPTQKTKNKVKYYELTADGKLVTIVSAVGHLYTVAEKNKKGWTYPVFDVEWVPSAKANKEAGYSTKYLNTIKSLAKKADTVTIATDFDIEGEVIGYTIMKYACGKEDANRMKYSTVTVKELKESYKNKAKHIAWGQAKAGTTRHELDWYYGINLSRALTLSVKAAGGFKILSSGRVQTPALKLLSDREKEIAAFEPEPYWEVELIADGISAQHVEGKFQDEKKAHAAQKAVTKKAEVHDLTKRQFQQDPPNPFDLTTLQTEAYKSFGMKPKETASHAQDLYSKGYTSYPRTSSQQLPESIGYKDILTQLQTQDKYKKLAGKLLGVKSLKPNNGKKTDPAHPAIFPTGQKPAAGTSERAMRVYDLIVRRFMATFGTPATRETVTLTLTSGGENFATKGTRTVEPGWHEYYGTHVKLKDEEMPALEKGQELKVEECIVHDKQTQPPRRYTPSGIIKELEKRGLGTKATRADIIESLFNRGYVMEDSIQVSEIGMKTIATLEKYVPEITDEKLTREIEEELEDIRHDKVTPENVLEHARDHLDMLLKKFKKHEKSIGEELLEAERTTRDHRTMLGPCPVCKGEDEDGNPHELQIRKGRYGLFVGCTGYPDCTATYKLPYGTPKPAKMVCESCETPMVTILKKRSRPQNVCINPECPLKELTPEAQKRAELVEKGEEKCPKCESPLKVRDSAYGKFIGCTNYPSCRFTDELLTKVQAEKDAEKEAETLK